MSIVDSSLAKPKRLLIITSSGGGGLIQAANAKAQEAQVKDPQTVIIRKDVFKDWLGGLIGKFCENRWNRAQIRGDVATQEFYIRGHSYFEYFLWLNIFFSALSTFFKEDVDQVIDTQVMGTSAIVQALKIFNKRRKKQIYLEKVLVDLPTRKAVHFFGGIKKLSESCRSLVRLTTIRPLLEDGETAEEFWRVNCNLSESQIRYEDLYVRQAFRAYQHKARGAEMQIKVRYKNSEELDFMRETYKRGPAQALVRENEVEFKIAAEDRLIMLMLGSQPANEATFNYVKKFIQLAKEEESLKIPTHLFVFCADHQIGAESLFRKVADYVGKIKGYPKWLSIIPFSFQNEDVIAPLFFRSDLSCTRSGGQTAMELMCVSQGQIWIHSEAKKTGNKKLSDEELLSGIPGWEAANALYLQKIRKVEIVTPETFGPHGRAQLRSGVGQAQSNLSSERPLESTA